MKEMKVGLAPLMLNSIHTKNLHNKLNTSKQNWDISIRMDARRKTCIYIKLISSNVILFV
jgi:hypothetical protein